MHVLMHAVTHALYNIALLGLLYIHLCTCVYMCIHIHVHVHVHVHVLLAGYVHCSVHLTVLYDEYSTGGAFDVPTQNTINTFMYMRDTYMYMHVLLAGYVHCRHMNILCEYYSYVGI